MRLLQLLPLLWVCEWVSGNCFSPPYRVHGSHPKFMLKLQSVTVPEGLCVLVPCTFFGNLWLRKLYSVFGYWFREEKHSLDFLVATNNPNQWVQKDTQSRFHLSGNLEYGDCSLAIRDAQKSDSGSYFFRLEKDGVQWNYCHNQLSVHVTALTHTPNINIPQTLQLGHPRNVTCSVPWACEKGTPPIFSWMSAALTSLSPKTTTLSSVLTLTPRLQDHGTNLTCQVIFPGTGVTVQKTVLINVTYTTQTSTTHVSRGATPGKAGRLAQVVLVAIGQASIKFLLLGICFLFISIQSHRKKVERPAVHVDYAAVVMD
ncbi:LOW QUALITY PROTEIN: sialic acid-binding Ig-like lectin 13 [Acomys russatus]|uniref:LOW QUALITY PROTEIN: sialic acid-binding Ig-like lectin 13 n=1 Tax=Acomys russatus TaxID=60746 RepID=UPI0021E1CB37|nr:LOW QUALITY PROTEIN: sialic acid-binding Ig-like lectin 13 [Acomys russatus]